MQEPKPFVRDPPAAYGPRIIATYNERPRPNRQTRLLPQRQAWSLWFASEGRFTVQGPGDWKPFSFSTGQVLLSQPGLRLRLEMPPGSLGRTVIFDVVARELSPVKFGFTGAEGSGAQPNARELWDVKLPLLLPQRWGRSAARLVNEACDSWWRSEREACLIDLRLQAWMAEFVTACLTGELRTDEGDLLINRAEDLARRGFRSGCTVDDLADAIGMSRSRFTVQFRKAHGISPGEFLRRLRMNEARHLLLTTTVSIATVARRCGYRSAPTFARAFKKQEGVEPSMWRRMRC